MKKAFTTLALALLLVAGAGLAGCASSCKDDAAKCADCGCPDCKAMGGACDKCKEMMKSACADCKAAGGMCPECKAKMGK